MIYLILTCSLAWGVGINRLPPKVERTTIQTAKKVSKSKEAQLSKDALFLRLQESNAKIQELLVGARDASPVIWEESKRVQSGKVVKARLLNSVVAVNNTVTMLLWVLPDQGLPYKSKIMCNGTLSAKRLQAVCSKLITTQGERAISALALNSDGSQGIKGSYRDGKDLAIGGAIFSTFGQGLLSAAQSKLTTPFGQVNEVSNKNMALSGLTESAKTAGDILLEDAQKPEGMLTIAAGIEVLVFFQEGINDF